MKGNVATSEVNTLVSLSTVRWKTFRLFLPKKSIRNCIHKSTYRLLLPFPKNIILSFIVLALLTFRATNILKKKKRLLKLSVQKTRTKERKIVTGHAQISKFSDSSYDKVRDNQKPLAMEKNNVEENV